MNHTEKLKIQWESYKAVMLEELAKETDSQKRGDIVHALLKDMDGFFPSAYWTHYKGGLYTILGLGVKENTLEPVVIYQSCKHGTIWVRGLDVWFEVVKLPDGTEVPRFKYGAP